MQTKRGAEQYEREVRLELLNGTFENGKEIIEKTTFEDFAQEFIETYATANNKWSEVENKRRMLKHHLLPHFGRFLLQDVSERHIEGFKALKLKQGISHKTINNYLACLRRLLAVAKEWQIIASIPTIKWMKSSLPDYDFLTFEEADLLIQHADPKWQTMMLTALKTGMRHGELLELRWDQDVNLDLALIKVNRAIFLGRIGKPKNSKSREIPICDQLMKTLQEHHRNRKSDLVFCNEDGRQLTAAQCRTPLQHACKAAGLRKISWHVFRHTFASHLVMRGSPIKVVQELLGHSSITMTMRYSHLSPDARYDAVQLLNSYGTIAAQKNDESCNSPLLH